MSNEPRGRRPASKGSSMTIKETPSSSSSKLRSSESGLNQPPPAQDSVVRAPRKSTQTKYPHHTLNSDGDETGRLRVYSNREKKYTEIDVTLVSDIDKCWISEDAVERLKLKRKPTGKTEHGCLGEQIFEFRGTVTLQWICKGKSEPTKCLVVPRKEFEVYLPSSLLPPLSPEEKSLMFPAPLSSLSPSSLDESSPSETSSSIQYTGSFDGDGLGDFVDGSKEAKWADKWMNDMEKMVLHKRKPDGYVRDEDNPPIKIAVLDTGVDSKHHSIKAAKTANRIRKVQSFVKDDNDTEDFNGHGTHIAALVLKVAPGAQLYVAKVASGSEIPSDHNIPEAIRWAIELNVDIITMSFGIVRDHAAMQKEIKEAHRRNIIMFAAASNRGHNYPVPFPARKSEVLCIYATDGNGNPYSCNPTCLETEGYHFATLGVAVKSAWPEHLLPKADQSSDRSGERRMTGTSIAAPIAAGIAACILDFARMHRIGDEMYKMLRCREGMQAVFAKHLVDKIDGGHHYIHPWKLFADTRNNDSILFLIKDTFQGLVGQPGSSEMYKQSD